MSLRLAALLMLWFIAPAVAMNWEGHDGYMEGFPPAEILRAAIPEAKPLPSPNCPVTAEMAARNPYEQIPLPGHNCPPSAAPPQTKR